MSSATLSKLSRRVHEAAEAALAKQKYVAPIDVLNALGWLHTRSIDRWRQGRLPALGTEIQLEPEKVRAAVLALEDWARTRGLHASTVAYVSSTRERRPLVFLAAADEATEQRFRTHWISSDLPESKREQLIQRQSKAPDLVVVQAANEFTCTECVRPGGSLLMMEDGSPLCLTCVDLDHLVFLPSGDTALTRRSKQASTLSAVVVQWNRRRKRYERRGTLVEEAALEQAEQQCLADADARARQRERGRERREREDVQLFAAMSAEIVRLFPNARSIEPTGSPATRRRAAAAGSADQRRDGRSTRRPRRSRSSPRYATRTPATTSCSCPAYRATSPANASAPPSTRSWTAGAKSVSLRGSPVVDR